MNEDQNPFAEGEEVLENEQTCWRDAAKLCGDDCVAYDEKCEDNPLWKPCLLLNLERAKAKSYANIAAELKRFNDRQAAGDEDLKKAMEFVAGKTKERGVFASKEEAEAYARQVKEMDPGPPEIK